jgi:hypothetical protein
VGDKKGKKSWRFLAWGIRFTFATMAIYCVIMCIIDWLAPTLAGIPHNIDGSVWFSVLGSMILAVPSIFVSVFAIYQSERVNELQAEKYRPLLALKRAELQACYVNWPSYRNTDGYKKLSFTEQDRVDLYRSDAIENNCALLKLKFTMVLKNDLQVDDIEIGYIIFTVNGKKYRLEEKQEKKDGGIVQDKVLKHKFESEWELYEFSETLFRFVAKDKALWDELNRAMLAFSLRNPMYREFEAEVGLRISFGTEEPRTENAVLKQRFGESQSCGDCCFRVLADSGRLSYSKCKSKG